MTDITRILQDIAQGKAGAQNDLLALVYDELRRMASWKIAHERAGVKFEATDLVQEAYIKLFGSNGSLHWDNRRHFFWAVGEAMRRILVDLARERKRRKNGGELNQMEFDERMAGTNAYVEDLLAINDILEKLAATDSEAAELFRHCHFCGMTVEEAASVMGLPERTAYRKWKFARTWLYAHVRPD